MITANGYRSILHRARASALAPLLVIFWLCGTGNVYGQDAGFETTNGTPAATQNTAFVDDTTVGTNADATGGGSTAVGFDANATGANSTAIGRGTDATADASTALGRDAQATDVGATALGRSADASGLVSTAVGRDSEASADGTTALGFLATAQSGHSTAIGANSIASFDAATALGRNAEATNVGATAIGRSAEASGVLSTAVGRSALAQHDNATALGANATTDRDDQMVFGTESNTYTARGITSGASTAAQVGPRQLVTTDAGGNLAAATPEDLGLAFQSDIDRLDRDVERVEGGVAMAMALSGVPSILPECTNYAISANVGAFEGETAAAVGGAARLMDNIYLNGGVAFGSGDADTGGRAGVTVAW